MTDQLQPGPALDEAIAKLLGWKETPIHGDWISPEDELRNCLPHFSTDSATAIATLEQLAKPKEKGGKNWPYMIASPVLINMSYGVRCNNYKAKSKTLAHAAALAMKAALEAEKGK